MKLTYKFFVRPVKHKDKLHYYVYLRITVKRKHIYRSIVKIDNPNQFDEALQILKGNKPCCVQGNIIINEYKELLTSFFIRVYHTGEPVTLKKISKAINTKNNVNSDFFEYCYNILLPKKQKQLKHGGYKKYLTEVNKIKEFSPVLSFADIDNDFAEEYFEFITKEKNNNLNTAHRAIRQFKAILSHAVRDGYILKNPLENFKTKQIKGNRHFLTKNELLKLHDAVMNLENKKLYNVGKYFLFSCYTGLRYSDIKKLKWDNINENIIRLNMEKTGDEIFIPINDRASKILSLQNKDTEFVFRTLTNQKTNQYLKDIAKIADINKHLTFHVARHTFATVSIEIGIPIEVVSKLLGHHDIKTTMIYARIVDNLKVNEMKKWNF